MPRLSREPLNPRKSPVQARSTASVDAMLEATIQVLLGVGKQRLTTTRVAARAGVSVGTLYQYFPNKSALLQAALRRYLNEVTEAVERVCREQSANSLTQMATALVNAFVEAKTKDPKTSVALYSVSSDVDGATIVKQMAARSNRAIVEMLRTARDPLTKDAQLVANMVQGAMNGVGRQLVESETPEGLVATLRQELVLFVCAYMETCSVRAAVQPSRSALPTVA